MKSIERRGKRLVVSVLGFLLGAPSVSSKRISPDRLRRVLVVRQDERLGNVLLITPLLEGLRRALPEARIVVLVSRRFADVLRSNGDIDSLKTFDKKELLKNPLRLVALIRWLRRGSFDLAVDCGPIDDLSLNNSLLTYLSGAPLRLGHQRADSHLFLNLLVPPRTGDRSEADRHLDLLRYLFEKVSAGPVKLTLQPEERVRARQRWQALGFPGGRVVAIHVGGRGSKQWGWDNFLSLAERLISEDGVRVILYWGPDEKDLVGRLRDRPRPGLVLSPPLSVRDLAAQLELCAVFVGNDTGPMHLAVAVGTPTVAVFLKANYTRYGPRQDTHRIIYHPDGKVSPDDVHRAVRELLAGAPKGPSS